jgi:hypothetical protein
MNTVVMRPWPMRLIRIGSSVNMIGSVRPRVFSKGDLVLVYDQDKDPLGAGNFKPMWFRPFIVKEVLKKGAYHLVYFEGNALAEPRNGLYLKKYYS